MEQSRLKPNQTYKVKLTSGRILGPIRLGRIRLLILNGQILGLEIARRYPQSEWADINQIPEIAELLIAKIEGRLKDESATDENGDEGQTSTYVLPGATRILSPEIAFAPLPEDGENLPLVEAEEKTQIGDGLGSIPVDEENESTQMFEVDTPKESTFVEDSKSVGPVRNISGERTVVFQRADGGLLGRAKANSRKLVQGAILVLALGSICYDAFFDNSRNTTITRAPPIRPQLPVIIHGSGDPQKSSQRYIEAMRFYVADTVEGYKESAEKLREAAGFDISNVKALAMLASSYLNLIDSSNKDERYFSVITQLIDRSRAKDVDLPETVIADVEFYIVVNKPEAAQNRISEYAKVHQNFSYEMLYYWALTFYARGDYYNAAKEIGRIPDNKAFSAKIFYLRGQIAEKLKDDESAMIQYKKAIQFNPAHAKSYLALTSLLTRQGKIKATAKFVDFLVNQRNLMTSKELSQSFFYHGQLAELSGKFEMALGDLERAVKLDPTNHDYLLELYTLRAKAGDSIQELKKSARMYFFLGEGERLVKLGKYQEALVPFLRARQEFDKSPIPLVKIGDMFSYLHDVENAKMNFKLAADRAPYDIQVWSKYIDVLIQSYEWEEAKKAMDKFRKLPVSQSAIDKAAADMYQKQGSLVEAQMFYKKAMARDMIDASVYTAYAKSLMSTKNFKDAPFFFALALRFDPLNVEAIINTSQCVAETESIDRAINMLQDELQKGSSTRAEFLSAIAELHIKRGSWDQAQQNIDQAMAADPDYALPWKLQAQIYMNKEGQDKHALEKALLAFKSYSERNASDPTGYLERYKIFMKRAEFENANEELMRIYGIYPKYPKLHLYRGILYRTQGNHVLAAQEFKKELVNNPNGVETLISYGTELLESGQIPDAVKQYAHAMERDPASADAKQNAGWANYKMKNYQAAVTLLRAALTIDRANPTYFKRLGIVYRDMGDTGSACGAFRKYLEMEPDAQDKAEFHQCF